MKYANIVHGTFLERENRFIAYVDIDGSVERVHVKNTGRCKELLVKGAEVYLVKADDPKRTTKYDLVVVKKGKLLINMDSQAPNKVAGEWLAKEELFSKVSLIKPETTYGNSRFDFYVESEDSQAFVEVKGVTLEMDGIVKFPDAPSERAIKHMEELIKAKQDGYGAFVLFVVQMEEAICFMPNEFIHKEFGAVLRKAKAAGVEIIAYKCKVEKDSLEITEPIPVYYEDNYEEVRKG